MLRRILAPAAGAVLMASTFMTPAALALMGPRSTATVPDAPTSIVATAGNAQVAITWVAPTSNGGATITAYTVTSTPGSNTCTTTGATTCTVTGLANGVAYTFTVKAANAVGSSAASTASTAVTPVGTAPGAPTSVKATAGSERAVVSWTAPTSNGGSTITAYTVTSTPDSKTCTTTGATTCIVTGLTIGTAYTFTVKAANVDGSSAASTASTAVTPVTVPGTPTSVTATAGNAQVAITWVAPTSNGGAAITGYTATVTPGGKTCTTSTLTCTVTGLTNGTAYTVAVLATNATGSSSATSGLTAATPRTVPVAPTAVKAVAGIKSVVLSWTAPASNGGSTITRYKVVASPGGASCTTTGALTCTVLNLTANAPYTFTVLAINAAGNSVASTATVAVKPKP